MNLSKLKKQVDRGVRGRQLTILFGELLSHNYVSDLETKSDLGASDGNSDIPLYWKMLCTYAKWPKSLIQETRLNALHKTKTTNKL